VEGVHLRQVIERVVFSAPESVMFKGGCVELVGR
jgi:hypothetical protein